MRKYGTTGAVFFLLLVLLVFVFSLTSITKPDTPLTYSALQKILEDPTNAKEKVTKATIINGDSTIHVQLQGSNEKDKPVVVPQVMLEQLIEQFNKAGVPLDIKEPDKSGTWLSLLSTFFLPVLLLVGFLFMFRSAQSGGNQAMSFGRSRAKLMLDNKVKVTFSDVA